MENEKNGKNENAFDHKKASISDKINVISELEHARRHCLRSAVSVWREEDDSDSIQYLIWARRLKEIRREYMRKNFSELQDKDWCLIKVCASLRQLVYETSESDIIELKDIEDIIDEITSKALGVDLSECQSCKEDRSI